MPKQIRNQRLLDSIARKIKAIRQEKGISQENFIHDTGIHIGRIETGRTNISVSTLESICQHFDLTLEAFFSDLDYQPEDPS